MTYAERILILALAAGDTDYLIKINQAEGLLAGGLDQLTAQFASIAGVSGLTVPLGLQQIFDRPGLIGAGSYDFAEGALTGPDYNLTVAPGAFWSGASFAYKLAAADLSLAALPTGDYYLNLDSAGIPSVSATANNAVRQFHWNASTHTVSVKEIYTGVAVLFDGDDYAACLASAARAKTFTSLAARLEELEAGAAIGVQTPASADNITIDWSLGGHVRVLLDRATTTFAFTGAVDGQKCILELVQDTGGGRARAFGAEVSYGTDYPEPLPISTDPDKIDYYGFLYNGPAGKYHPVSVVRGY